MTMKTLVLGLMMMIVILALVAVVGWIGYGFVLQHNPQVGSIVQTRFNGNHTFLQVALTGAHGGASASISAQDAANILYCDVTGSMGLYSSWASTGGMSWKALRPDLCQSASKQWYNGQKCDPSTNANGGSQSTCLTLSHLQCGQSLSTAGGLTGDDAWLVQCGAGGPKNDQVIATCSDLWNGVCVVKNDIGYVATCSSTGDYIGTCLMVSGGEACEPPSCPFDQSNQGNSMNCGLGQQCSSMTAAGTPTGLSYTTCIGPPLPHILLNVPMLAEGVVTAMNDDGSTANVAWNRVSSLYNAEGPIKGWNYQKCRFIANPTDSGQNQQAASILFGDQTGKTSDPKGFLDVDKTGFYDMPLTGINLSAVLPASGPHTGWDLTSLNVPLSSLTRVAAYTILPIPATAGLASSWTQRIQDGRNATQW